ncbi:hypothetical protein BGZ63DRAFT_407036 [Mariannaea sp. PMI_226]|nr:hypothetical protein BGZ63DRAFT_407036 [Mariannaea sp. PMI_226]
MSTFPIFRYLPTEVRLMIWKKALQETVRVLRLNADIAVACLSQPQNFRVVFGGRFTSTWPPEEGKDIVWPPKSERNIQNISLSCWEARQVALSEYPNLITVEEPDPSIYAESATVPKRWTGHGFFWTNHAPLHRTVRCNFKSDIICLETVGPVTAISQVGDGPSADIMRATTKAYGKGIKLVEFLSSLKQIEHLIIESPWKRRRMHEEVTAAFMEAQYRSLFSGMTNLRSIYIYRNNILPPQKNPYEANWDKLLTKLPFMVDIDMSQGCQAFVSIAKFCENMRIQVISKETWPSAVRTIHDAADKTIAKKQTRRVREDNVLVEVVRMEQGIAKGMPTIRVISDEWLTTMGQRSPLTHKT